MDMWLIGVAGSITLIFLILLDSFETTVLPRRVTHRFRFARLFYAVTWSVWRTVALRIPAGKAREAFLSLYGPSSLLGLLTTWVLGLIFGFASLHAALGTGFRSPDGQPGFGALLYWSGVTFFTLGYGEITPASPLGQALAVVEAGLGFGFLAIIIGYLPVIYQVFSSREVTIALLDARAGSPPTAAQCLLRLARSGNLTALDPFLAEWERWAAELLESHLSFPVLSYYRSQHDNQSWLAALTAVLDTCAFLIVQVKGHNPYQAQLTFAMARHAAVDLALVLRTTPLVPGSDRLAGTQLQELRRQLQSAGLGLHQGMAVDARLAELRGMYEPFVNALAQRLLFTLPPVFAETTPADNWQRSAWMRRAPGIGNLPPTTGDDHFE
jgi:voltage-gated potassium channel Kch